MKDAAGLFDVVLLVVWIALGATTCVAALTSIGSNIHSYTESDKITVQAMADNTPEKLQYTAQDALLMLVVADENQPYPKRIIINSNDVIEFNPAYFTNTETKITQYWNSQLKAIIHLNIEEMLIENSGGKLQWKLNVH